jgi:hypothetical protein
VHLAGRVKLARVVNLVGAAKAQALMVKAANLRSYRFCFIPHEVALAVGSKPLNQ